MTTSPEGSWARPERAPTVSNDTTTENASDSPIRDSILDRLPRDLTRETTLPLESASRTTNDNSLTITPLSTDNQPSGNVLDISASVDPFKKYLDAGSALGISFEPESRFISGAGNEPASEQSRPVQLTGSVSYWDSLLPSLKLDKTSELAGTSPAVTDVPKAVLDKPTPIASKTSRENVPEKAAIIPERPPERPDVDGKPDGADKGKEVDETTRKTKALFDPSTSESQKLDLVRELVKAGVTRVNFKGSNGESLSLRLEVEPVRRSAREMVHMFISENGGKERVVLRGIAKEDGSFEQQRNPKGNFVSYFGSGKDLFNSQHPDSVEPVIDMRPPDGKDTDLNPVKPSSISGSVHRMFDRAASEASRAGKLMRTSQGIYLRSDFDVDVDGSPRAKEIDRYGSRQTSWSYSQRSDNPYINAEEVPYIVLPKGKYQQFGIELGDYALVRDKATGKVAVAVFADVGPASKTGEGSINLANKHLGLDVTPNRGISEQRFEFLVFPGSGEGKARNQEELLSRISSFKQRIGLEKAPDRPDGRGITPSPDGGRDRRVEPDGRPGDTSPGSIFKAALDSIGKAMWGISDFRNSVRGGRLGCAAAVSEVLQLAGIDYANAAGVGNLVGQLMNNGWTRAPLSQAEPGDVVVKVRSRNWRQGGGGSHIGVVGEGGKVYHNSSSRKVWVEDNLRTRFGGGLDRWVLKPPKNA